MSLQRGFPGRRVVASGSGRGRRRRPSFDCLEPRELLATFIVRNNHNAGDHSLRWAIGQANRAPGGDTIRFDIPGGGIQTIALQANLPEIKHKVAINGYTQPGATINTLGPWQGDNAIIQVVLKPASDKVTSGLIVAGGHSTAIEGLDIVGFTKGAGILLNGGTNTSVAGDFLGLGPGGTIPSSRNLVGVQIIGSQANAIGGLADGDRNLISGNLSQGIRIQGNANLVVNDLIGTDRSATGAMANGNQGVFITSGSNNTVGGFAPGAGNVISGNSVHGVDLLNASGNQVLGNRIGTRADGLAADPNQQDGVIVNQSSGTVVSGNLISGNGAAGGLVLGAAAGGYTTGTVVTGNLIGVAADKVSKLGNAGPGVQIAGFAAAYPHRRRGDRRRRERHRRQWRDGDRRHLLWRPAHSRRTRSTATSSASIPRAGCRSATPATASRSRALEDRHPRRARRFPGLQGNDIDANGKSGVFITSLAIAVNVSPTRTPSGCPQTARLPWATARTACSSARRKQPPRTHRSRVPPSPTTSSRATPCTAWTSFARAVGRHGQPGAGSA